MDRKIATTLLRQRDPKYCRQQILIHIAAIALLLIAHGIFSRFSSPLKLIPQMFVAIMMGWSLMCIYGLRQFPRVAEFIDWQKVIHAAEQDGDSRQENP